VRQAELAKLYEDFLFCLMWARGNYSHAEKYAKTWNLPTIIKSALKWDPLSVREFKATPVSMQETNALVDWQLKKDIAAGTTTDELFANPLFAMNTLVNAWFATRRSASAFRAMLQDMRRVPVGTRIGVTTGFGVGAQVEEAGWTPATSFDFEQDSLLPLKAQALVILTDEILRFSGQAGSTELIGTELMGATSLAADSVIVPLLLSGLTLIPSSGDARTDIREALSAVTLNQASKPYILTSTAAVKQLALMGATDGPPAFPDASVPNGGSISGMPLFGLDILANYGSDGDLLMIVDANQCAGDGGDLVIQMSDQGSVQFTTAPTQAASPLVSLFQTHTIGTRADMEFTFKKIRTDACACISHVNYAPGSPS
jgi:hypothetical protein